VSKLQEELKALCAQYYADGYSTGRVIGLAEGLLQGGQSAQTTPQQVTAEAISSNPHSLLLCTPVGISHNRRRGNTLEQMHRPHEAELTYPPLDFPGFGVGSLAASERVLGLSSERGELSTATAATTAEGTATDCTDCPVCCSASKQAHDLHNNSSSSN